MLKDRFDRILTGALVVVLTLTLVVLAGDGSGTHRQTSAMSRQMEQEMLYQARLAFIERHYRPVLALRDSGSLPDALLKLKELDRTLPGEAHNALLTGDILLRMGQYEQALSQLAAAVRNNADYVDAASPLSQRPLVESAVASALPLVRDRLRAQPDSHSLAEVVREGYYLQSRLAGGCE